MITLQLMKYSVRISAETATIPTDVPQTLWTNCGLVPTIRQRPFCSSFSPVRYLLWSRRWTLYSEFLTAKLHACSEEDVKRGDAESLFLWALPYFPEQKCCGDGCVCSSSPGPLCALLLCFHGGCVSATEAARRDAIDLSGWIPLWAGAGRCCCPLNAYYLLLHFNFIDCS